MKKSFKLLILKNTLAIAIPAIAVFVVLICLLVKFPVFERINDVHISQTDLQETGLEDRLEELYLEDKTNIEIELNDLYYTGFNYKVDGRLKGAYYYSMSNGKLHMYLIATGEPENYIGQITIKGKLLKDSVASAHILTSLVQSEGIDSKIVEGYASEYIISEVDYPKAYIVLVYLFYAIPIIISIIILIFTGLVWFKPDIHSQSKQLASYGDIKDIIRQINEELNGENVYKKKNIYITQSYMLVNYLTKTDVIKLDLIKYLSKNEVTKSNMLGKKINVFRLTVSNPDTMFYEIDFGNEELCDEVMEYMSESGE